MKEGSSLATMVSRRSPTDSPNLAGSKSHTLSTKSTAVVNVPTPVAAHPNAADDGAVVRVKAQVMTRSDEGWVAVDGGGLSFVGVYRRCVHVPIEPTPGSQSRTRSAKDKESDCTTRREKSTHKELSEEADLAIECSATDDDKPVDGTCKVQCYECTEFCIRAQRITDGRVTLTYVMNKDLAYQQPQPLFHHWRCICEACKCGATTTGSATFTQRSILSNQSSTNSSLSSWPVRASNNYVNLPTAKHRLAKNDSVDSTNVNQPSSFTGSLSSCFGSNALQQLQQQTANLALPHNHGSFGLTFESSTDARAFYSAVRSALDKLESEAKADAVNITIYPIPLPIINASAGTALPSAHAPKVTVNSQMSTSSGCPAVRSQPSSTCDSQSTATGRLSAGLGRKQSSPNVLDASPSCSEHPPLAKTYSDPPASTYTLPAANGGSNGQADSGRVKQLHETHSSSSKSQGTSAEDYSCLWDPDARVRHPATLNAAPVQSTRPTAADKRSANGPASFDFDTIVPSDISSNAVRHTADSAERIRTTHYSTSTCDDSARRFRNSPPAEPTNSRLTEGDIGLRHLDSGTKRSSSLSRLNHYGVRSDGMSYTKTNVQLSSETRPSPSPFLPASKRGTPSMRTHETANPNLYVCSSYPHLANNSTQLLTSGACPRSSPSNVHACVTGVGVNTNAGSNKAESGSPRFLKLFRSKKRGSRCDTSSISSMSGLSQSLLTNVQAQPPTTSTSARRSSKNSASRRSTTTTRPTLTRARCRYCQQEYYVERNPRGACSEAPAKAQRCGRSNGYFSLVDSCMQSLLKSDNSDTEFEEERLRSSHSHSSARSSGAHDHEDSGISTFSTSASHNRRHASSHPDEYDIHGDERESNSHKSNPRCCAAPHCRRRRWLRRLLVGLLSAVAPCVWCYWLIVCYSSSATSCCTRCVGARHEPMPVAVDPNAPDHNS